MNDTLKQEIHVILHGQPSWFRVMKYLILLMCVAILVQWKGWEVIPYFLLGGGFLGVCLHFVFRWKTDGWKKSWGLYNAKTLNNNKKQT